MTDGRRTRVAVLFGGPSREHGVSFFSARCLLENLPHETYEATPLFVGKDGLWHDPTESGRRMISELERPPRDLLLDGIAPGTESAPARDIVASFTKAFDRARPHVVFPMVHGTWGEDGVVQGLLEALGIPYVGFGVAASAVAMDKVFMKAAFGAANLPQVHYIPVDREEFARHGRRHLLLERLEMLRLPLFVKPSCAGSSVGVTKVKHHDDLPKALASALEIDARALVEEGADAREIECSVLEGQDGGPTEASLPGEIVPGHEFYDYEDKYIDDKSRSVIPADLSEDLREEVRGLAIAAFDVLGGAGFARVDFFLERGTGRVLLNEINSLPGFTPISMYPKMWEASGLPLPKLLDRLVRSAFARPARGR
ncbi:MAG TPA: D-alanine--D-alanine ligase family protein [Thermoanaerobaculia bacterium]|nr:D-alanine--D-alanine ligase family protein [Thermoanaerobaculia bacterium]